MSVIDRLRRTLLRHNLASPSTRVVVALSGGPDSVALLHALHQLHRSAELRLVAVAHLNHQLRPEADADEQFCADMATGLGLPFTSERADVRRLAEAEGRSLEDAAHALRTAFFARAATSHQADAVAVGHSRDDQAETVLLRLLRGAGTRGLSGMYPRNGIVIRPLLECARADLRAYVETSGLRFVHDASNDDVGIPRNRVRAEVLPLLADRFNPRIVETLAREADLARVDHAFLDDLAAQWASTHVEREAGGTCRLDADALAALPEAMARRAVHTALEAGAGGRPIGLDVVDRALALATRDGGPFDAPGQRVQRSGRFVVLSSRPRGAGGRSPALTVSAARAFSYSLPVPGEVRVAEIGRAVSAELAASSADVHDDTGVMAVVPQALVAGGLAVRNRRPGDRLRPSPAGHRKLQDLLVDRKVPRAERDRIPIVTDAGGRIVWVAGHALDQVFRVSDPAQAVVVLRLKGVGGSC